MLIRLGYVSISNALDETTSSTLTYSNYEKIENKEEKLDSVIRSNLEALKNIVIYNIKNNIHFYRLTSKLIPLSTHPSVHYEYIKRYKKEYNLIGNMIKENKLRIDTHPDQFVVLNSINKDVICNSIKVLEYHYKILDVLGVINKRIILHVGSNTFGKEKSINRFIRNFNLLPEHLKKCIVLENDDKIFTIDDIINICKRLDIPPVLDVHHYNCNEGEKKIVEYLDEINLLWKNETPKYHFSSPKSKLKKEYRSHSDYIDIDEFIKFIKILKEKNNNADIMLEVKQKDDALFRLVRQLKYKTNYDFVDDTSFIV